MSNLYLRIILGGFMKIKWLLFILLVPFSSAWGADNPFFRHPLSNFYEAVAQQQSFDSADTIAEDSDLVRAVRDKRNVFFVSAKGLQVTRLMPDDTKGNRHQKWYVRLSNGRQVYCVYNIDFAKRVPLSVSDHIDLGGHFIWAKQGPLVHWLHEDPQGRRPDGFVNFNGERYGKKRR